MLKDRASTVLRLLVHEYVVSAMPVASEVIARRAPIKVSAATVRSEMAELEEQGYITRAHVSAGGVPSDKGYRFYVESSPAEMEPPRGTQQEVRSQFAQVTRNVDAWTHHAAVVLSRLADNMAIATPPRASASRFKYLQLVHLQDLMALLVVVLQETRLRQQLLPLPEPTTQDELTEMANRLNGAFAGLTYLEIEARELPLGPLEEVVMEDAVGLLREVEAEAASDYFVDGFRLLLDKPEFSEGRGARVVMELVEEPSLLRRMVSRAPQGEEPGVFIGEENVEEALRPFGVILCHYGIPRQASGVVGVVGPTRMEYPSVKGRVRFLASVLGELMWDIHRTS